LVFLFGDNMDTFLEQRIKILEEEIAYLHKDMAHLITIIESIQPEVHYHFYQDFRTCKDDQSNSNDLNDFI